MTFLARLSAPIFKAAKDAATTGACIDVDGFISTAPFRSGTVILILAVAPAIGVGICRFAYSPVLPDMRDSLGWSYSTAGFMNTINAAGYPAGAVGASAIARRFGLFNTIRITGAACILSPVVSALSADFFVFSAVRLVSRDLIIRARPGQRQLRC